MLPMYSKMLLPCIYAPDLDSLSGILGVPEENHCQSRWRPCRAFKQQSNCFPIFPKTIR